jgi:hypothetical protein
MNHRAVVNVKEYANSVKAHQVFGSNFIYVGRGWYKRGFKPSPLSNPYTSNPYAKKAIKVAKRSEAIELYRKWLWRQIGEGNEEVLAELRKVKPETVLGCHCKPWDCHADVVHRAAAWLRQQESNN